MPSFAAGAANTEEVHSRGAVPVSHEYAAAIINAKEQGNLDWQWLWTNVGSAITQDIDQTAQYQVFLDFLRVASVYRPPVQAGNADRDPQVEREIVVARATGSVKDAARTAAAVYLPGLACRKVSF